MKLLHAARRNWAENREEGNALVFALLVLFVCVTTAAVVAAIALTSSQTTKNLNSTLTYQSATDTALANALLVANSPSPTGGFIGLTAHRYEARAVSGELAAASSTYPVKWRWYADRVASSGGQATNWYIYADAYTTSPTETNARHVRMTISPLATSQASYDSANNRITYIGDTGSAFQYGLLGTNGIGSAAVPFAANVRSYDSQVTIDPSTSTNNVQVATNGVLTLGSNTGVNVFNRFSTASCTPAANCPPAASITDNQYAYNFNVDGVANKVAATCPAAAATYPNWVSSTSGALVDGGCYNTLTFNSNTVTNANTRVYVKGNITIASGVQVNYNRLPSNLQIYSQGGSTAVFANGTALTGTTYFNGLLAGGTLACADSGTPLSNSLQIHGSLACSTLSFGSGTTLWLDDAARNVGASTTANTVYNVLNYQVSSKVQ